MKSVMRIAFYTLGCKVNQYETQALEQLAAARGHVVVPFEGEADAYVVNTCTVTAVSDKKSRQVVRRARKLAPEAVVAVCGCYPQTHPNEAERLGADLVAGTGDRAGFVELLEQAWRERQPITVLDDAFQRRTFETLPAGGLEGRTRAMLKIQDGCTNFCSYCIIPYARGRLRSLPLEDCVEQAGGDAAAMPEYHPESDVPETVEADVIVVGAGAAGLSASITAAEGGADVVVIEKQGVT